jgi:hypothetical protein
MMCCSNSEYRLKNWEKYWWLNRNKTMYLFQYLTIFCRVRSIANTVECLPNKCQSLGSILSTTKKKKKRYFILSLLGRQQKGINIKLFDYVFLKIILPSFVDFFPFYFHSFFFTYVYQYRLSFKDKEANDIAKVHLLM